MSMIDDCIKRKNIDRKVVLIVSTSRRFYYLQKTIDSLFQKNPSINDYIKKVWILDDRSSKEDRFKMQELFSKYFKDNYNMVCFNSGQKYDFIEKFNFIKKVISPTDIVFLLEEDWECVSDISLSNHIKTLYDSDYTQISFTDPLNIQEDEIKNNYKLNDTYWKNPWPKCFKHVYKYENDFAFWNLVRMNHFTLSPSLIKASVFLSKQFIKEKNFEVSFADASNNKKHMFTINQLFKHIGDESMMNEIN